MTDGRIGIWAALREQQPTAAEHQQYRPLAQKAVARLGLEWGRLVTFYQFQPEYWCQLRATNLVESPFAIVRLRTTAAKPHKRESLLPRLIWKLRQVAEQTFRWLNTPELLPVVYAAAQYADGVQSHRAARQKVAA
jgi:transposase-like protein